MKFILQAAVVFVATVAADFAWTKYMLHTAAKRPHLAGIWSAAIILCGAVSIVTYTQNPWLILPALLGAYVGTYLAVTRELTKPSVCDRAPPGWSCSRESGHDGPCAAAPLIKPLVERWAPPCDHRNCTVSEQDGELLRWSCGRIEG